MVALNPGEYVYGTMIGQWLTKGFVIDWDLDIPPFDHKALDHTKEFENRDLFGSVGFFRYPY